MNDPDNPKHNAPTIIGGITTTDQSGGSNTQNFNFGPKQRVLNEEHRRQLLAMLPSGKPVLVAAVALDSESVTLGNEVSKFLTANGYSLRNAGVAQAMGATPFSGIEIEHKPETTIVLIGTNSGQR